jgi:hypothetical protein
MRRTLTVVAAAAAMLVPAGAASASTVVSPEPVKQNASCNSGLQRGPVGVFSYNEKGNLTAVLAAGVCVSGTGTGTDTGAVGGEALIFSFPGSSNWDY